MGVWAYVTGFWIHGLGFRSLGKGFRVWRGWHGFRVWIPGFGVTECTTHPASMLRITALVPTWSSPETFAALSPAGEEQHGSVIAAFGGGAI